ncbi:MAG: AAA family ATPase [Clostridia bacterium]|nr:AAA family ATPase [Clostridia bacterium]
MAKMILICGPQAVGKMTVGQQLAKITKLKFMHNHETIDLPLRFFDYNSEPRRRLTDSFREQIITEVAKSNLEGMIFTLVFAFDSEDDWNWVNHVKDIFESNDGEFYLVELETTLEERLARNKTENRLKEKPTKRDIEFSEKDILSSIDKYRMNSYPGEVESHYKNYIRIDNTNLSPEKTAKIIKEKFNL